MKVLKPREAMALARSKGWVVKPKRRTGEWLFISPAGKRFVCQAPGRSHSVPVALVKALS